MSERLATQYKRVSQPEPRKKYYAVVIDAVTGSQSEYEFREREDLLDSTPIRIIRAFVNDFEDAISPFDIRDYEINAAIKNEDYSVVTAMGVLIARDRKPVPFMLLIGAA